ncbi:uncharacterized protein LOC106672380 [Cimex lectularius]|uniref:Uncharacterized protein n=1 Tax=Cimex lectularius TaxID=79782 RepID=A0A8I6TH54_CIMLE|nr:uncharacterized protein LOC106672380 [Cimex lectularius]
MANKVKKQSLEDRIISLESEMMKMAEKETKLEKKKWECCAATIRKEPWHTTIYDLEFCAKPIKKRKLCKPHGIKEHDGDPIAQAYKNELKSNLELEKLANRCAYENGDCYYYKLLQKNPSIIKVVESPVKQKALEDEFFERGRSVYQIDYCRIHEKAGIGLAPVVQTALEYQDIEIPQKWQPVPLTEYRSSYRDHKGIAPWELTPSPIIPPKGELTSAVEREKKILNAEVGETEYRGVIGTLGWKIIRDEFHGKIPPLPHELVLSKEEEVQKTFSSLS